MAEMTIAPTERIPTTEEQLIRHIQALEPEIGPTGVGDIMTKVAAIFSILPGARLSLINDKFDLIGVSSSQLDPFFPHGFPAGSKCYSAYNRFERPCRWCTAVRTLNAGLPTTTTNVVTPEHINTDREQSNLVHSDIMAIPCGIRRDTGAVSHCIEIVTIETEREKSKFNQRNRLNRFMQIMFERLQHPIPEYHLQCLLLFGCLYGAGERITKAHLYVLSSSGNELGSIEAVLSIEKTPNTDDIWQEILAKEKNLKIATLIDRLGIELTENSTAIANLGMGEEEQILLQRSQVCRYDTCQKAAVLVEGIASHQLSSFILVIDKTGLVVEDFVNFDEMAYLDRYATFCHHTLINRRWFSERTRLATAYNRLADLSQSPLRDAYVAGIIISNTHTAASQWRSNMLLALETLLNKIPPSERSTPAMKELITTFISTKEVISSYFFRMDKWRAMTNLRVKPVSVKSVIESVLDQYKIRLGENNVKLDITGITDVRILADKQYLQEVLADLLQNAYDACYSTANPKIQLTVTASDDMARICIEDNGKGFDKTEKELIWTPGYTTKVHGTGQGLPFVKYAVEVAFHGKTQCYSDPGNRTGFVLYIPLFQEN